MFFPNNFQNCSGGAPPFPFFHPMMMMNPEDMEEMTKEMERIAKKMHEKQQENPHVHPLFQFLNNPESMQEVAKDVEEMAKKFNEKQEQKQKQDQKPAAEEKEGEEKPSSKCANNFFDLLQNMAEDAQKQQAAAASTEQAGDEKQSSKCANNFFDFVQNMAEEVHKNIPNSNAMEEEVVAELFPNKNKTRWNESDDTYTFEMEVPGVRPHQVVIEEKGGDFEVNAIRIHSNEVDIEKTYRESFYVSPAKADISRTFATLIDGILTIAVPKKENKPVDLVPQKGYAPPPKDEEEFRATLDLPGVKIGDLQARAHKGKVWVRATRQVGPRKVAIKRVIDVQPPSAPMEEARAFLQDGVFTLVVPVQKEGGEDDEQKLAAMRVIYVAQDEVPMADFADDRDTNPWAASTEENTKVVETVSAEDDDSKEGWDQVEAAAEAKMMD